MHLSLFKKLGLRKSNADGSKTYVVDRHSALLVNLIVPPTMPQAIVSAQEVFALCREVRPLDIYR